MMHKQNRNKQNPVQPSWYVAWVFWNMTEIISWQAVKFAWHILIPFEWHCLLCFRFMLVSFFTYSYVYTFSKSQPFKMHIFDDNNRESHTIRSKRKERRRSRRIIFPRAVAKQRSSNNSYQHACCIRARACNGILVMGFFVERMRANCSSSLVSGRKSIAAALAGKWSK